MRFAGMYAMLVGALIFIQWGFSLATAGVPELEEAPFQIVAHLTAEFATAVVLVVSGIGALKRRPWAPKAYFIASGMLIYTVINSSGYFAQLGRWEFVALFVVLLVVAIVSLGKIVRTTNA